MEIRRIKIFVYLIVLFLIPSFSHIYGATLSKSANNLGLQLYYSFDEGTSTRATDFSGRGRTGTLVSMSHPATASSGWSSGKFGKALNFDGTDDNVLFSGLTIGTTHTISMWIKPNGGIDYQGLITDSNGFNGLFYMGTTRKISYFYPSVDNLNTTALQSGVWNHVVAVVSAGTVTFYINGVSDGTAGSIPGFTPINIGSAQPFDTEDFTGGIDEVRVYNRALTVAEVRNLYSSGSAKINSSQNNLVKNGLVGMWSFDSRDMTSSIAYDSSGFNNVGTLVGTRKNIGKLGQALVFNGTSDYVSINPVADNVTETSFAVTAWVKCSAAGGVDTTVWGTNNSTASVNKTGVFIDTNNFFMVWDGSQEAQEITSSISACNNTWHHTVYTRTGSTGTLYVDGISQGTHTAGDTFATNDLWAIGMEWEPGLTTNNFINGSIDEVRVYNRPLSQSDINALYGSGSATINASQNNIGGSSLNNGLVGMWSFNSKDLSDKVYDRSGNSHDGYFIGGATSSAKTIGKSGQAINFDGVNDSVLIAHSSLLDLDMTESATFSFWINRESAAATVGPIYKRTSGSPGYSIDIFTSGAVSFTIGDLFSNNNRIGIDTSSTMNLNQWYHVVVTYDGSITSGGIKIYFDGVLQPMTNAFDNYGGGSSANGFDFSLGARETGTSRLLDGKMDEVRMYNRVLTDNEIKQLYLLGK